MEKSFSQPSLLIPFKKEGVSQTIKEDDEDQTDDNFKVGMTLVEYLQGKKDSYEKDVKEVSTLPPLIINTHNSDTEDERDS